MNTSIARQLIHEKRMWWQATVEHMTEVEQMAFDSESKFHLSLALQKLRALDQNEQRLANGTFGRCERCGRTINDERLELIIDNESHLCMTCASHPGGVRMQEELAHIHDDIVLNAYV